ncbi:MAG: hypothetical protein ACW99A_12230 [Candidatus Kariarchaeaceae archaeon]|jgi:hypothetical protein
MAQVTLPVPDGIISNGEWDGAETHKIRMNNGIDINFKIIYSETDVYYLATFPHKSPGDVINRNPTDGTTNLQHDYFGIEFDLNNDGLIMGTSGNPDDMVLIDYDQPGAVDMFSHSYKVFKDENYEGESNVEGASNDVDGVLIYEFRKSLNSTDSQGYDISLADGDKYYIMFALWDDKFIHSAAGSVNIQRGNSQFLEFVVGGRSSTTEQDVIIVVAIVAVGGILGVLFYLKSRSKPV